MTKSAPTRRPRPSEEGYILIAVIFLLALFTIALAVALPKISKEIQRDRELETMHRGKQYIRAVKLYYKKFGAYPANADALIKPTNNIRFLRKKYADPTTGKEDWKPVLFGQNKAPTAMGFFGQPMGSIGGCPINPLGANTSQNGLSSGGIGGTPSPSSGGGTSNPSTGNNPNCPPAGLDASGGTSTGAGGTNSTDPNAPQNPNNPNAPQNPNNPNAPQNPNNPNAPPTDANSPPSPGSTTGLTGQTMGGLGIIGFSPNSPKKSILVYKKKNHYNEWEFVYDPLAEQQMMQGAPGTGGVPGISGTGIGGTGSGSGSGSGAGSGSGSGAGSGSGSGTGSGSGSGTSTGGNNSGGTVPTPPSTPQ